MYQKLKVYKAILISLIVFQSCSTYKQSESKTVLAKVNDEILYLEDVLFLKPKDLIAQDSIDFVAQYIENWTSKEAIANYAEKNTLYHSELIELKIEDYRKNLIIHEFHNQILNQKLDTIVSDIELNNYYKNHKNEFLELNEEVKGIFIKGDNSITSLYNYLQEEKNSFTAKKNILTFLKKHKDFKSKIFLDNWVTPKYEMEWIPFQNIDLKPLNKNQFLVYKKTQDNDNFLFVIFDFKSENNISSFENLKPRIKSIILNARKIALIKSNEEEIIKKAVEQNQIEIFNP